MFSQPNITDPVFFPIRIFKNNNQQSICRSSSTTSGAADNATTATTLELQATLTAVGTLLVQVYLFA